MKKWYFCLSCLLSLQLLAANSATSNSATSKEERVRRINQQIELLDKKIGEYRLREMNKEMESQPLMFEQWDEYAEKMEEAEKLGDTEQALEKKRQELILQREKLTQEK